MRRRIISDLVFEYRNAPKRYQLPVFILSLLSVISTSAMIMSMNFVVTQSGGYVLSVFMFGLFAYSFITGAMGILGYSVVQQYHEKQANTHYQHA